MREPARRTTVPSARRGRAKSAADSTVTVSLGSRAAIRRDPTACWTAGDPLAEYAHQGNAEVCRGRSEAPGDLARPAVRHPDRTHVTSVVVYSSQWVAQSWISSHTSTAGRARVELRGVDHPPGGRIRPDGPVGQSGICQVSPATLQSRIAHRRGVHFASSLTPPGQFLATSCFSPVRLQPASRPSGPCAVFLLFSCGRPRKTAAGPRPHCGRWSPDCRRSAPDALARGAV